MLQSREHGQLEGAFRVKPRKFGVLLALTVLVSGAAAEARTGVVHHQGTPRMAWRGPARIDGKAAAMQHPRRRLPRYVPGEVIVQFRRRLSAGAQDRIANAVDGQVSHPVPALNLQVVTLPSSVDPLAASKRLSASPGVFAAEPNWIYEPLEVIPTDPAFADQWGLSNTGQTHPITDPPPASVQGLADADADVSDAWSVTQGSPDTVIAIIDSGVDLSHPDLSPNLWVNIGETAANGIDDEGNGYVDDIVGYDTLSNDSSPQDDTVGHGSHVAGIAAAAANNSIGGAGVCPACKLMVLRAGDEDGFPLSATLEAIVYAVDNGANIINMSLGGPVWSKLERKTLAWAGANGVLVIAAAGNEARDNDQLTYSQFGVPFAPSYPASYDLPNIVSVAASNDLDRYGYRTGCDRRGGGAKCVFTNWGHTSVDLAAPGVDIVSTFLAGGYTTFNGTSMSAPFVAGVAGLVLSLNPSYTPQQVKNAILNSVDHPQDLAGGFTVTSGRLNAQGALTGSTANATPRTDGIMAGAVTINSRKHGSLSFPTDINDIYKKRLRAGKGYAVLLEVPRRADYDVFVWKPGAADTWPVDYGCGAFSCLFQKAGVKGRGKDEYLEFTARKTGTYYFHVTLFSGRGAYTLRVGVP
jgi:subtilisin family serine protease